MSPNPVRQLRPSQTFDGRTLLSEWFEFAESFAGTEHDQPSAYTGLASMFCAFGEWDRANQAIEQALNLTVENDPDHGSDWRLHYQRALLSVHHEDDAAYRAACQTMLERLGDTTETLAASFTAWTCVLVPQAVEDYSTALTLARQAHVAQPDNDQLLNSLGAILYRDGQYQEALRELTAIAERLDQPNAVANGSPAYCWYFLAMTHQALGQTDEARTWLKKANAWPDEVLTDEENPPAWNRRLTLELLRDEASTLIGETDTAGTTPTLERTKVLPRPRCPSRRGRREIHHERNAWFLPPQKLTGHSHRKSPGEPLAPTNARPDSRTPPRSTAPRHPPLDRPPAEAIGTGS